MSEVRAQRCDSLEGAVLPETRAPDAHHALDPGASATVLPAKAHHLSHAPDKPCRALLNQGAGLYDFVQQE